MIRFGKHGSMSVGLWSCAARRNMSRFTDNLQKGLQNFTDTGTEKIERIITSPQDM